MDLGLKRTKSGWLGWISEESPNNTQICPDNEFASEIKCTGRYCDSISLKCSTFSNSGTKQNCQWIGPLSEEDGGFLNFPPNKYLVGVQCSGSYCDNKKFYVCGMSNDPSK